jgi:hypothetical protein
MAIINLNGEATDIKQKVNNGQDRAHITKDILFYLLFRFFSSDLSIFKVLIWTNNFKLFSNSNTNTNIYILGVKISLSEL